MIWFYFIIGIVEILLFLFLSIAGDWLVHFCQPLDKTACIIINSFLGILPGLFLIYYSFTKKVSKEAKKKLNKLLLYSILVLVIAIIAGTGVYYIHNDSGNSVFVSFGIIALATGILLLKRVYLFYKAGRLKFFREGVIGLGFHEVQKEKNKHSFSLLWGMMATMAILLIVGGMFWIIIGFFNIH